MCVCLFCVFVCVANFSTANRGFTPQHCRQRSARHVVVAVVVTAGGHPPVPHPREAARVSAVVPSPRNAAGVTAVSVVQKQQPQVPRHAAAAQVSHLTAVLVRRCWCRSWSWCRRQRQRQCQRQCGVWRRAADARGGSGHQAAVRGRRRRGAGAARGVEAGLDPASRQRAGATRSAEERPQSAGVFPAQSVCAGRLHCQAQRLRRVRGTSGCVCRVAQHKRFGASLRLAGCFHAVLRSFTCLPRPLSHC